jgi:hypothetical protein
MATLIESSERHGIWTLQSSIFEENVASARLHARHGFRTVGRRDRVGLMTFGPHKGQWRDTILIFRPALVSDQIGFAREVIQSAGVVIYAGLYMLQRTLARRVTA